MIPASKPHVRHTVLRTTFSGVEHPLSTPNATIYQFRGIKYAAIPARFRQSKLFTSYAPVTDTSRFGPISPQLNRCPLEEDLIGLPQTDIPKQSLMQDEFECLNLNITCPAGLTPLSKVPVMLWIHGGFDRGSGSNWVCDGGGLVRKSMVIGKPVMVVTFNFRLGILGSAASPALYENNKVAGDIGVGNYGLRDQRRAMEWLHYFINEFGGDGSNVTLFGESTGASDILCHLQSAANESNPLFHRAIVQSAIIEHNIPDVHTAGWHLSRIMSSLGVRTLEQLRAVDVEKLVMLGSHLRVTDDGVFFRMGWKDAMAPEDTRHRPRLVESHLNTPRSTSRHVDSILVADPKRRHASLSPHPRPHTPIRVPIPKVSFQPLIIGDCANESLLWSLAASRWTAPGVVRRVKAVCQCLSKATALLRAYDISAHTPEDELVDRVLDLINDARVAWPTDCASERMKRMNGVHGVWRYVFDQEGPARGVPHHAADLIYLFDNIPLPASADVGFYVGGDDDDDDDDMDSFRNISGPYTDEDWSISVVDEWSYSRVRDAIQARWISFAHGESPWNEDKVFVFGPEGESGERSKMIFEGRRRKSVWKQALEPLGLSLVQKVGVELSNGPPDCPSHWGF